jgi:deazaflavin-dependent oxidoreductase (nitroreductase family)
MRRRLANTHPERGLLRLALRLPICLYRAHLGWLLGNRFLLLTHIGRKSGMTHRVVLEVVRHDKETNTCIVASGWGEKADWLRNLQQTPEVVINTGLRQIEATAVRLSAQEADRELRDYAQRHPIAFRLLAPRLIGQCLDNIKEDFCLLAQSVPVVALRPRRVFHSANPNLHPQTSL